MAALKQSLHEDQARLRQYEWIETKVISLRGEEKSRQQSRCYHGADGKVQKVPVSAPPPEEKRGLRGKVVEKKKEELGDYMERAAGLVKLHVPPDPGLIQKSMGRGQGLAPYATDGAPCPTGVPRLPGGGRFPWVWKSTLPPTVCSG